MLHLAFIFVLLVAVVGAVFFIIIREQEHASRLRQYEKSIEESESNWLKLLEDAKQESRRAEVTWLTWLEDAKDENRKVAARYVSEMERLANEAREVNVSHRREVEKLESELATFHKYQFIPDVIERANRVKEDVAARIRKAEQIASEINSAAEQKAREIISEAEANAEMINLQAMSSAQSLATEANNIKKHRIDEADLHLRQTEERVKQLRESAQQEADELLRRVRAEVKEKGEKAEHLLSYATIEAQEIVDRAEKKAVGIGGKAYEALKKADFYGRTADAMYNVTKGYGSRFMVPPESILDAWAEEYGFHEIGMKLKVARDVVRIMEKNRTAASCEYAEANRRETAINFVVDAFRGKVDSIKSRIKKDNYGTLRKEIVDAFALVNFNGKAFRDARIADEYLDAILNELKWAAELQRLREADREEQRQFREKIREEEKAKREYERAIKQAQRDEELLKRAMEEIRKKYDLATLEERAKYEARLQELSVKLTEAEERNQRALSMAQQTKQGHVYIISNVGSFGEDVYKIGLTRRLEPLDRVKELGDASVPFPFDVHAMIYSSDAPTLEHALHKLHLKDQVNKVNPRKEFFRIPLADIRKAVEELEVDVKWTLAAEAREYRETLVIEESLKADPEYQKRWLERQVKREIEIEQEDDQIEADGQLMYANSEEED
jgi:hypothetical protein